MFRIEGRSDFVSPALNKGNENPPVFGKIFFEHLPYLCLFGTYLGAGILIQNVLLGRDCFFQLMWRYLALAVFTGIFFIFVLSKQIIILMTRILALFVERLTGKTRVKRYNRAGYFTIERFGGFAIIIVTMPIFLSTFSNFKQIIPLIRPFDWDRTFKRMDLVLHGGYHPWIILQPFLGYPTVTKAVDFLYVSWFLFLFFSIVSIGWTMRRRLRAQFFLSFILVWMLIGTILAILFSSAGPCYYAGVTGERDSFQYLMTYLDSVHKTNFLFAVKFQRNLWNAYVGSTILPFGGISAMPSVHVATAVLFALAGLRINRLLGILLIIYAIVIQIGSVHLGWHYAIDGYFSSLLTICIWKATGRFLNYYHWISGD